MMETDNMVNPPRTIQQAMQRLYGFYPGEPYDMARCAYEVVDPHFGPRQCFHRAGRGRAGLYCRQHAAGLIPPAANEVQSGSKEHLDALSKFFGL